MVRARSRVRHVLGTLAVALVLSTGLVGCEARPRVIVYGDSLVWESGTYIRQWAAAWGWDATLRFRFGGAPCSLYDEMRWDEVSRPEKVIITFAGNSSYLAPCVGADISASYRAQMREVKRIWAGSGTELVWAAVPFIPQPDSEPAQIAMREESLRQGIRVIDGGKYVTPGRVWRWTLPCMPGEYCNGHQLDSKVTPGHNIVRANDLTHFCPGAGHGLDPCAHYMSGAWRFGRALAEALGS